MKSGGPGGRGRFRSEISGDMDSNDAAGGTGEILDSDEMLSHHLESLKHAL